MAGGARAHHPADGLPGGGEGRLAPRVAGRARPRRRAGHAGRAGRSGVHLRRPALLGLRPGLCPRTVRRGRDPRAIARRAGRAAAVRPLRRGGGARRGQSGGLADATDRRRDLDRSGQPGRAGRAVPVGQLLPADPTPDGDRRDRPRPGPARPAQPALRDAARRRRGGRSPGAAAAPPGEHAHRGDRGGAAARGPARRRPGLRRRAPRRDHRAPRPAAARGLPGPAARAAGQPRPGRPGAAHRDAHQLAAALRRSPDDQRRAARPPADRALPDDPAARPARRPARRPDGPGPPDARAGLEPAAGSVEVQRRGRAGRRGLRFGGNAGRGAQLRQHETHGVHEGLGVSAQLRPDILGRPGAVR